MSGTDIYLCANTAPHAAADIELRTVAPCAASGAGSVDDGHHYSNLGRGVYPLGRSIRRPRKTLEPAQSPFEIAVQLVDDLKAKGLRIERIMQAARERRRMEDDLLLADLL